MYSHGLSSVKCVDGLTRLPRLVTFKHLPFSVRSLDSSVSHVLMRDSAFANFWRPFGLRGYCIYLHVASQSLNFVMWLQFVLEQVLCHPHVLFAAPFVDSVGLSGTVRRFLSQYHGYHIFVTFFFTDSRTAVVPFRESFTSVEMPHVSCSWIKLSLRVPKTLLFWTENYRRGNCSNPYYCKKNCTSAHYLLFSELYPGRTEPLSKMISGR